MYTVVVLCEGKAPRYVMLMGVDILLDGVASIMLRRRQHYASTSSPSGEEHPIPVELEKGWTADVMWNKWYVFLDEGMRELSPFAYIVVCLTDYSSGLRLTVI